VRDADLFADFNPLRGVPIYDDQSPARRWLDALDEGPELPRQQKPSQHTNFGTVGADHNTKPKTAAPTAAQIPKPTQ
jgi:hypothetical protein